MVSDVRGGMLWTNNMDCIFSEKLSVLDTPGRGSVCFFLGDDDDDDDDSFDWIVCVDGMGSGVSSRVRF